MRAQDVALGDDAGVLRERRARRGDEQRGNPRRGHFIERRADRSFGADEPCRRHQVADAVAVRIAVDRALSGSRVGGQTAFRSSRRDAAASSTLVSARHARIASARVRMFLSRSFGISASNTRAAASASPSGGMAVGDLDAEPCGEALQREVREVRLGDLAEQARVERRRRRPGRGRRARTRARAPRDRSRRCARSGSCRRAPRRFRARRRRSAARRRPSRRRCRGCAMAAGGIGSPGSISRRTRRRSRRAGRRRCRTAANSTHARLARIEPGGLGVDDDRVERDEGSCAAAAIVRSAAPLWPRRSREITLAGPESTAFAPCVSRSPQLRGFRRRPWTAPAPDRPGRHRPRCVPAAASSRSPPGCCALRPASAADCAPASARRRR